MFKKYVVYTSLLVICFTLLVKAQTVIPIIDLRENDSQGIPKLKGQNVTVAGVVTTAMNFGSNGPASIEDNTAGISIYGSGFAGKVQIGDSVTVTSTLDQFNGLSQLDFRVSGSTLTIHKSKVSVDPLVVTLKDITSQEWGGVEELESRLLRVNNVTITQSGSFSGNSNYEISDSTGKLEMRIDADLTDVIGTAIPNGAIDIVGVLGQYKYSTPYSSGYQILIRSINDIITAGDPLIINPVSASNITSSSFIVYFSTVRKGNSEIRYGLTQNLELGSVSIQEDTTFHSVLISGLEPFKKYYFKAYSTNVNGTSESTLYNVLTSSLNPSTGAVNVYFNFSVDNSVAIPGNEAKGDVDFKAKLLDRINAATYSIDMAVYSFFGLNDVANSIVTAKKRGVKVRVVYDSRTMQSSMQILKDNGIQISQRPNMSGIMHNKFAIFDGRDNNPDNDWLWTGSWNWTSTELDWRNNVVEINNENIAAAYQTEFEEMWGSNNDIPNSANAKFGPYKIDNTPHSFTVNGKELYLYFSPSDNTENYISQAISSSDSSIYFSMLAFTSDPIFNTINQRHDLGITDIRGIINDINVSGSEYQRLQTLSGSEIFQFFSTIGKLHHKYGLVDAYAPENDPLIITGSHNWSNAANTSNDENTLIIHDLLLTNQFMQEFKKRYNELGGTTSFSIPVISSVENNNLYPTDITLYQNYPNPFNPITTIRIFIPSRQHVDVSIYNTLGEKVETLYNGVLSQGIHGFDFNGKNLSSGIYLYRLKSNNALFSKKLLLLK
ncbi:MAG: T9SS type A sorting domain-containing protein [Bacteroidetes bacterium]|nr:T9SS type A sorting domain-containing protein [Bacteroidota bacterium]